MERSESRTSGLAVARRPEPAELEQRIVRVLPGLWLHGGAGPELLVAGGDDHVPGRHASRHLHAIAEELAKRHLADGDMVLYDLTSSYFEGVTCPLARIGKSRDRKRNTLQVNYGLAFVPQNGAEEKDEIIDFKDFKIYLDPGIKDYFEGVTLDGSWSQYKSPQLIWGTILKDPDKIKRERPALFQKIKSVRSSALQDSI